MPRHKPVDGKSYMIKIEHETMERLLHATRWLMPYGSEGNEINRDDVARGNECDHRGNLIRFILAEASASILEEVEDLENRKERCERVFGSRLTLSSGPSWTSLRESEKQRDDAAIETLLAKITEQTESEKGIG